MYLLKKDNVRKKVSTEAKRDALIALGYTEVKEQAKPPDNKPPESTGAK